MFFLLLSGRNDNMNNILTHFSDDIAAVSASVLAAVVQIRNGQHGAGAGTIWQANGLIVTNAHVIGEQPDKRHGRNQPRGQTSLIVRLADGREYTPRLLAVDTAHDLAALQIDAHDLPTIALGNSAQLRPGQLVFAFGHPYGVTGGATAGVVIGVGTQVSDLGASGQEWVAASLHLRPGHSGGPMVDVAGRLIGINTLMNGPDVGVAVPVDVAKRFIQAIYAQVPQTQIIHV